MHRLANEHDTGLKVLDAALELPRLASSSGGFRARYYDRLAFGLLQVGLLPEAVQAYRVAHQADPSLTGPRVVLAGYREMVGAAAADPVPAGSA